MASANRSKSGNRAASASPADLQYCQPEGFSPQTATNVRTQETAAYIAQLTGELSKLAGAAKLETLAYLLAMARLEADILARE